MRPRVQFKLKKHKFKLLQEQKEKVEIKIESKVEAEVEPKLESEVECDGVRNLMRGRIQLKLINTNSNESQRTQIQTKTC